MPTASEAASAGNSQLQVVLDSALEELAKNETITFSEYTKVVLSPDGSVFWVKNGNTMTAKGSLHVATDSQQLETETIGVATTIFSSETLVNEFVNIAPTKLWIGAWPMEGVTLKIAFSSRGRFYEQAQIFHYSGHAVYPVMQSQIIDSMADLPTGPIVSNSLPIWLSLTTTAFFTVPVYPSFLVPDNILPPYIVAHVEPGRTSALASLPVFVYTTTPVPPGNTAFFEFQSTQLCRDEVRLTFYGFTNDMALQYYAMLINYSNVGFGDEPTFGFADSPAFQDEKRTQNEITALAQKKTLTFQANYFQSTTNATAYRLILTALPPAIAVVQP